MQHIDNVMLSFTKAQLKDWIRAQEVWNENINQPIEKKILALLGDYTKNDSALVRFFTFHVNRHNTTQINAICIMGTNKNAQQLIAMLKDVRIANPVGTTATYLLFIQHQMRIHRAHVDNIRKEEKRRREEPRRLMGQDDIDTITALRKLQEIKESKTLKELHAEDPEAAAELEQEIELLGSMGRDSLSLGDQSKLVERIERNLYRTAEGKQKKRMGQV